MNRKEFVENVRNLFFEFEIKTIWDDELHSRFINRNEDIFLVFCDSQFRIDKNNRRIYASSEFDDFEIYLDELIVFKELILPKYL